MDVLFANLAVFAGAIVQGSVGFGLNLVAAPILLIISTNYLPGPATAAGLFLALAMTVRDRAHLDFGALWPALVGRVPGVIVGAAVVSSISAGLLRPLFAATILLAVGVSLIRTSPHGRPGRGVLATAGLASGLMGTVASIGGPPMALALQRGTGPEVRANLNGYFIPATLMSLTALAAFGEFGITEVKMALLLVPGLAAGFLVSFPLRRHVDRGRVRPLVLAISALSALMALLTA